jgi:uncharacterized protein (TIGR02996 family)
MDKDEAFRRALKQHPEDDALRLVYADWLEEQGDPRGEFIRLVYALDDLHAKGPRVETSLKRLQELERTIDPQWIALVMAGRVCLKYHRKTFALLNEKPVRSKENVRLIEKWEKRRGIRLPASVREWYSLEAADGKLNVEHEHFYSGILQQVLQRAPERCHNYAGEVQRGFPVGGWDGGAVCYVPLDGDQDPEIDAGFEYQPNTFSSLAFVRVWSNLTRSSEWDLALTWGGWQESRGSADAKFPLLQADDSAFGRRELKQLSTQFSEGVHQLVNGHWQDGLHPVSRARLRLFGPCSVLRYFSPTVRVQVICKGNPAKRSAEAHWHISADSAEDLVEAVAQYLWGLRTLSQTLTGTTKAGKTALTALRRRFRNVEAKE